MTERETERIRQLIVRKRIETIRNQRAEGPSCPESIYPPRSFLRFVDEIQRRLGTSKGEK